MLRKSSLSGRNAFQVADSHPKNPRVYSERAVKEGTSQRNVVFFYRKQHITALGFKNSSLHKVAKFWGQHSHSRGVKLTPQLDQEKVWVCVHSTAYVQGCAYECVYTQLCFFNDTYSHIPPPRKTGWPQLVLITWRCSAPSSAAVTKTKCHWLLNACFTSTIFFLMCFSSLTWKYTAASTLWTVIWSAANSTFSLKRNLQYAPDQSSVYSFYSKNLSMFLEEK